MNRIVVILMFLFASASLQAQKVQDACFDGRVFKYSITGPDGMLYHWRPDNGRLATADTLNDTILIKWNSIGTYRLRVFGEIDGCFTDYKEIKVTLHSNPIFSLGEDVIMCEGERHTFAPGSDIKVKTIKWQDGNMGTSYTADTTEKVWTSIVDVNGCKLSDTAMVYLKSLPYVNLGPDTSLCGDQKLVLNALTAVYDGLIYKWSMPNPNNNVINDPAIEIGKGEGEYSVIVTDVYGCTSYDTVRISKCDRPFDRSHIGMALTPNNDGYNDVWDIVGLSDEYPDAVVDVYDRWGRKVFRSDRGYTKPWDGSGTSKREKLPMDSYYYIINLNNEAKETISGTLILIR